MSSIFTIALIVTLVLTLSPQTPTDEEEGDIIPPKITIFTPYWRAVVSGNVSIYVEAVDEGENASGVESYEIYIDNELKVSNNSYWWNVSSYEDGSKHVLHARAYDKSGNVGYWNNTVVVDNTLDLPPSDAFKVMVWNIHESGTLEPWLKVMREENADIVILDETGFLDNSRNLEYEMNHLNGYFYYEAPYDGRAIDCLACTDGKVVLSRYPILEFHQIIDYRLDDGSIHHYHRAWCDCVIDIAGTVTHMIGYHGKCCSPDPHTNTTLMRENETQGIINYMDDIGDVPIMFGGDFNSNSPFDVGDVAGVANNLGTGPIKMLLMPEDPVYGKYCSHVHNFTDTWRTMYPHEKGWTFGLTMPQYWGRIDFLFVNQHWADKMINGTTGDTPSANISSDHYSVDAFFSLDANYSYFNTTSFKSEKNHFLYLSTPSSIKVQSLSHLEAVFVNIIDTSLGIKRYKI